LAGCIESSEDASVGCPYVNAENEKCTGFLNHREIKAVS